MDTITAYSTKKEYKMSEDECREKINHKWKSTGQILTSNPPQYPEICSVCGAGRVGHPQNPMRYTYNNPKDNEYN